MLLKQLVYLPHSPWPLIWSHMQDVLLLLVIQKKTELYAVIVDHIGPPVSHKGLLGMNFLSGLDYKIDFERRVIIWK